LLPPATLCHPLLPSATLCHLLILTNTLYLYSLPPSSTPRYSLALHSPYLLAGQAQLQCSPPLATTNHWLPTTASLPPTHNALSGPHHLLSAHLQPLQASIPSATPAQSVGRGLQLDSAQLAARFDAPRHPSRRPRGLGSPDLLGLQFKLCQSRTRPGRLPAKPARSSRPCPTLPVSVQHPHPRTISLHCHSLHSCPPPCTICTIYILAISLYSLAISHICPAIWRWRVQPHIPPMPSYDPSTALL
jgi:hypothetical protein